MRPDRPGAAASRRIARASNIDSCEWVVPNTVCGAGSSDWYANDTHFENNRSSCRDLTGLSTNKLLVGIDCRDDGQVHTCGNGFSIVHAQASIYSAFITINDPTSPALGTPTGIGWITTDWAQAPCGSRSAPPT